MLQIFVRHGDGRVSTDSAPAAIVAALRDLGATIWVDLCSPTPEESAILDDVFGFHPLAIEDTMVYTQRPKIDSYNHIGDSNKTGYFFMVIHGPDLEQFKNDLRTKELDLFVSERYLVTVHEEPMRSVDSMAARASIDPHVVLDDGIDRLLHNILDILVDQYLPIFDYFQEALDDLEEDAAENPRPALLQTITQKKRDLLNLRRVISPQRDVIAQLTRGEVPFIREATRIYFRDVLDHLNRAVESIEIYRDLVMSCRDVYMSSINNHLNQIMKTLTIISVVALPMTVITSFFGMNFTDIAPQIYGPGGLVALLVVMCVVPAVLLWAFWKKRWL